MNTAYGSSSPGGGKAPWAAPILLAIVALAATAAAVACVVVLSGRVGEPTEVFVRDTTAAAGVPWYYGVMSTLGVVVWGATSAWACSRALAGGESARPMACLAVLTAFLCADDALLIHERGTVPVDGTDERIYFALYAVLALVVLVLLLRVRSYGSVTLLLGAGGALLASILVDLVAGDAYLIEDALKLAGAMLLLCVPIHEQWRSQAQAWRPHPTASRQERPVVVDLTTAESPSRTAAS